MDIKTFKSLEYKNNYIRFIIFWLLSINVHVFSVCFLFFYHISATILYGSPRVPAGSLKAKHCSRREGLILFSYKRRS